MESSQWEYWNLLLCCKVLFLTSPHCHVLGVDQGMKQTYLYLWYPLHFLYFKIKGIDVINKITKLRIERKTCMKSSSYEYSNKSVRSRAQLVPIWMPNITNMLSIKNLSICSFLKHGIYIYVGHSFSLNEFF